MSMSLVVPYSPYILGIDLGTSNSAIAYYKGGRAEVIPIDGNMTCPSVFHMRDNGDVVIGRQARSAMLVAPQNTVASVKRDIGTDRTYQFPALPDKSFTPTDISAEILAKLAARAAEADGIDLKGQPKYVVICVPANFEDSRKLATKEAATLANLDVLWLLEEPVAAAIAYAMDKERDQTILVYDLGGGTFDVSILQVISTTNGPASFKILGKAGVQQLGGDDFDYKLMQIAAARLAETSGIDVLNETKDQGISKKQLREARQKLKDAAETAKCELTEADASAISIPNLIKDESGKVYSLDIEVTKAEFNEAIHELILQSKDAVQRALDEAKLAIDDISRIIMVGGSTRVPLVREVVTEMFGKEPYFDANPDTAVARGAAMFGASLGVPDPSLVEGEAEGLEQEIIIKNITTHCLGIETFGGKFNCLIEKGLDIPTEGLLNATKEFGTSRDNMTELTIRVYQSDPSAEYVGNEGVAFVGEFFLTGIPAKPKGQERVSVTFEIDQQNLLRVSATSSTSSNQIEIQRS